MSWTVTCLALALAMIGGPASAADASGDVYTLETCPVSGMKLGSMGDAIVKEINGREVRFCSGNCPDKFEADAATYTKKMDAAFAKQQMDVYPLSTCVVSGEKLSGMGEPINYVHNNRLVRFCCKGCVKKFEAGPAKFIAKLDKAIIHEQGASYRLATCVVSGEKLGGGMGDPIDYVVANRLVRFCCKGCVKKFEAEPAKYLASLSGAKPGMKMDKKMDMGGQGGHSQREH